VIKTSYSFTIDGVAFPTAPASCNGLAVGEASQGFVAAADPTEPTNPRFFATNASGSIYEHSASLFATMPEVGQPTTGHVIH
jgi:hypothetical protein